MFRKMMLVSMICLFCSVFLIGCLGSAANAQVLFVGLALLGVSAYFQMSNTGCSQDIVLESKQENRRPDGGTGDKVQQEVKRDGVWEPCCQDGKITTCFCPGGADCNYGLFKNCGTFCKTDPGATCEPNQEKTIPDKTNPDNTTEKKPGGTWEPCCQDGKITTCFCPGGAACNYGLFKNCGTFCKTDPSATCEPNQEKSIPDTSTPDKSIPEPKAETQPDGTWQRCCKNKQITTCFCPAGLACNYGQFRTCSSGVCVGPTETCPVPEAPRDGVWEQCCKEGKISTCFCPGGAACNYGLFQTCANGTCTLPGQKCP